MVLSGGGINGVLMELGFLKRLQESPLWSRVAVVVGTSSGALSGAMAVLDDLDGLEAFILNLQPDRTFRPHRLWRLPFLGLHEYALPATTRRSTTTYRHSAPIARTGATTTGRAGSS